MRVFEVKLKMFIGVGDTVKLRDGTIETIKSIEIVSFTGELDYPVFIRFEGLDNFYSYDVNGKIVTHGENDMDIVELCGRKVDINLGLI